MKNTHVEHLKKAAKQFHCDQKGDHFDHGVMIFHRYPESGSDSMSWWDDVTFILNDYRVALAWIHPRMAFQDAIDDEIARLAPEFPQSEIWENGIPQYKSVGKSRKTVSSWAYAPTDLSAWHEHTEQIRHQVMQTTDFRIIPYLRSHWCPSSRLVYLCAPVEIHKDDDLHNLVVLTKRLLKREISMQEAFPTYQYTREDWERESLHLAPNDLHVHRLR